MCEQDELPRLQGCARALKSLIDVLTVPKPTIKKPEVAPAISDTPALW